MSYFTVSQKPNNHGQQQQSHYFTRHAKKVLENLGKASNFAADTGLVPGAGTAAKAFKRFAQNVHPEGFQSTSLEILEQIKDNIKLAMSIDPFVIQPEMREHLLEIFNDATKLSTKKNPSKSDYSKLRDIASLTSLYMEQLLLSNRL
jgi:hypothetical protein